MIYFFWLFLITPVCSIFYGPEWKASSQPFDWFALANLALSAACLFAHKLLEYKKEDRCSGHNTQK